MDKLELRAPPAAYGDPIAGFPPTLPMTSRRALLGFFVIFAAGMYAGYSASLPSAAATDEQSAMDGLESRVAEANLKLAEIELRRAAEANQRVGGAFPRSTLDALEETVQIARHRTQQLESKGDRLAFYVQSAEAALKTAQGRLLQAQQANERARGAVPNIELARLTARAELAQLKVQQARGLEGAAPQAVLNWRLDQLQAELLELRNAILFTSARQ